MFKGLDKGILYTTLFLVFSGFFIFFSASLSSLKNTELFVSIFSKQIVAIFLGLILMFVIAHSRKLNSLWLRIHSGHIFIFFLILQLLVLVPGWGLKIKGGQRWLDLGFFTIQPSEFFKYSFIIFFVAVVVTMGKKLKRLKSLALILILFLVPIFAFFLFIRDMGTLLTILFSIFIVLLVSEVKQRYIIIPSLIFLVVIIPLLYFNVPYIQERLEVYVSPEKANILDEAYQWNQSITTVGSGQLLGRGFGGSLQKFHGSIPEPLGDSIFAVYSEEFGFIGSSLLILTFTLLLFFIFRAAKKQKKEFDKILITALGIMVVFPAFYNIAASIGVFPISGMPITFISKGGTAILTALIVVGIILRMTRKQR